MMLTQLASYYEGSGEVGREEEKLPDKQRSTKVAHLECADNDKDYNESYFITNEHAFRVNFTWSMVLTLALTVANCEESSP